MAADPRLGHERRVLLLGLLAALPGTVVALALLWTDVVPRSVQWTLTAVLIAGLAFVLRSLRAAVVRPLETMTNVVAALREGDFSVRFHLAGRPTDAMAALAHEVNALSSTLREQRLGAAEAAALLHRVME